MENSLKQRNILVTGGAGFIGSNFISFMINKYDDIAILVNFDKLTYAADLKNLDSVSSSDKYKLIEGDICDAELVSSVFKEHRINEVYHFAAESHVDNSISGPREFINTNIVGTFNLLQAAYQLWMDSPFAVRTEYSSARFLHVSTDEVYGSLGDRGLFTEDTPYSPNSPYSASKASSDFIVRSYHHTFGMNVVTTNCSNNYGPNQHSEKFIPTIIKKAIKLESIPVYGNGKNIRDWLYVEDHCLGIDLVFRLGKSAETYNIGGSNEKTNIEICEQICNILDQKVPRSDGKRYFDLVDFVSDRHGHDFRYAIDASKISNELGWSATETFESAIIKTVDHYLI